MPEMWGYCNTCQRWFYVGSANRAPEEAICPVCTHPAVCLADHNQARDEVRS